MGKVSGGGPAGPVQMNDDVLSTLSQAQRLEDDAKKAKREWKQRQKANRKLRKAQRTAARAAGINAIRATGYSGPMFVLNSKGERIPVVYDATIRADAVKPIRTPSSKVLWEFPDCKVEMIEWVGPLKAFRVQMGQKLQTVVPDSLKDMQDCIIALDAGVSPVNRWQDGSGRLVCPANAVPRNGPAKRKPAKKPATKSAGGAKKPAASGCSKAKAPAKKTQPSKCVKKKPTTAKAKAPTKPRQASAKRKPTTSPNKRVQRRR